MVGARLPPDLRRVGGGPRAGGRESGGRGKAPGGRPPRAPLFSPSARAPLRFFPAQRVAAGSASRSRSGPTWSRAG